jgi:hypothetical protein
MYYVIMDKLPTFKIKSKVPDLCKQKGLTKTEFYRQVAIHGVGSQNIARRLFLGQTGFQLGTAKMTANLIFGLPTDEVFVQVRQSEKP